MTPASTRSATRRLPAVRRSAALRLLAFVPAAALVLCSVSSDMVAMLGGDPLGIWRLLPAGPVAGDWVSAEVSSTAFLLVGISLARGKRLGFWMALAMMAGALVVQGASLDHPVSAGTALAIAVILVATRGRYNVGTSRREARLAGALVATGAILAALCALLAAGGVDAAGTVADAVGSLLDLATPVAVPGLATFGALLLVGRIAYVVASVMVLDSVADERPADVVDAARRTLRRVGTGALYPYQLAPECAAWADDAGTAAIAVASVGRSAVAMGDPAGDPVAAAGVLDAWIDRSRRADIVPIVYQASAPLAARLRERGWRSVLVGREAIIDPSAFDLRSSGVANLRHTVTRSRRGGISTVWSATGLAGLPDPRIADGLVRLDEAWRRKAGPQLGFTVGRFDPAETRPTGIAVALDGSGTPVAFIVVRPTGGDGGWMLDVMRRTHDSVPGALEACLVTAIEALGASGVRRLSLGLAPLSGLDPASGVLAEQLLARGARAIRPVYNHEGLAFFKNKFAPQWEARYLVVPAWTSLTTAVVALLRLHLGGGWPKVVRSLAAGLVPAR